ncbi:MAG: hypothetical protein KKF58_00150 [Gammaproteobacteria bacterium]|nr:hypothetical protein [Gammaproteobacteria bacterium]MBU1446696.1 hypothetical protein [Gammaproteobacteria bacterium]
MLIPFVGMMFTAFAFAAEPDTMQREASSGARPAAGQSAGAHCEIPQIERASGESVASFKKRLRIRQQTIETCQRIAAANNQTVQK